MTLTLHPDADGELMAAAQFYEHQRAGLGERFLSDALDAFRQIELHPARFPLVILKTRREIRRRLFEHFPYAAIYQVLGDRVIVAAITHSARRPAYWRSRIT
jgi:plasmid stabilization system protein ParE